MRLKKLAFVLLFFLKGEDTKYLSLGNDRPYSSGQQALLDTVYNHSLLEEDFLTKYERS